MSMYISHIYVGYVHATVCVCVCVCGSQRTICWGQFSPSAMPIDLRSLGVAISPAHNCTDLYTFHASIQQCIHNTEVRKQVGGNQDSL